MYTFALLEKDLPTAICQPSVRKNIHRMLRAVKEGKEFHVPGWSPNGVRVVLNSNTFQFRTLYVVSAERCDCGDLKTNDAIYCVANSNELEHVIKEIYRHVSEQTDRFFDQENLDDYEDDGITPPEDFAAGLVIYNDPDDQQQHSIYFVNSSLDPKAGVGIMADTITKYFNDDEEDEDGAEGEHD